MQTTELLRTELSHYLILADQLKAQYAEIDEETLCDTLEGISDLPQLIQEVVRSSLEDETLIQALKSRIAEMSERLDRFKRRSEKKRALACWAMGHAGLQRLQAEDFSASLRHGAQRLEILDEAQIPSDFLVPQPPRLDRSGLLAALKGGKPVEGAMLVSGDPHISVRVR
jgi:Siphovirus Gp157